MRATRAFLGARRLMQKVDRFILGGVVFAAVAAGMLLYGTRSRVEPTAQTPPLSAPETPAIPGGKR